MSAAAQIDYDALAAQHGGAAAIDYDALAAQHGGTTSSAPLAKQPSAMDVLTQPTGKTDKEYLGYKGAAGVAGATVKGFDDVAHGTSAAARGTWDLVTAPPKDDTEKAIGAISPIALPFYRSLRALGHSAEDATKIVGAVHDINNSADPAGTYLNVAQDTAAQGAGQALTALGGEGLAKAAPVVADAAQALPGKGAAVVRGTVKAANTALQKAPGTVGAAVGGAIGAATRVPYAGEIGAGLGSIAGKELLPQIKLPGEGFGFPNRVVGGETLPPEATPTPQPAPVAATQAAPEAATRSMNLDSPRTLSGESALRKILTGQDNGNLLKIAKSRGIDVTQESQLKAGVADGKLINKIIDDFSDDELEGMRSQFIENTRMGKHQFGDIGPEAWKTMGLQSYFPDVKIPAATLRRTQNAISGATAAATPQTPVAAAPKTLSDLTAPTEGDLTSLLQKSLDQAKKPKKALSNLGTTQ